MNNYKKLKVILLLFVFCFSFLWNVFAYRELMIQDLDWKPIRVMKVVLDWQDFVITSLAGEWWDTLENLVKNVWWDAGINGTFFCPADYSYCNWVTHSTFERVFLWKGVSPSTDTSVRMIFGFDIEWSPFMAQSKLSTYDSGLYMNWNIDNYFESVHNYISFEDNIYVPYSSCSTGIISPGLFFSSKYILYAHLQLCAQSPKFAPLPAKKSLKWHLPEYA